MSERMRRALRNHGQGLLLFVVLWVLMLVAREGFRPATFTVLDSLSLLGLAALAVSVPMIAREFDFSVGSMAVLSGMITVRLQSLGLVLAIFLATVGGVLLGSLQGYLIQRLRVNSLVLTLGTSILLGGLAFVIDQNSILFRHPELGDPLVRRFFGVLSLSVVIALIVFAAVAVYLAYVRGGREIYAVGGDRSGALASGVSEMRALVTVFGISGGCAALLGSIAAFQSGSASPNSYSDLLFRGIAAALIGGISLHGGRGTVLNVLLGAGVLTSILAGLAARGSPFYLAQLVTGALLIGVIGFEWTTMRLRQRVVVRRSIVRNPAPMLD